jgi:hypothetical protein
MGKIGHMVVDPKAGAYCRVTLDSGDKLLVNHDRGDRTSGTLTVQEVKWWGLGSGETLFACRLDSAEGRAAFERLVGAALAGEARQAPLPALLASVASARSITELRARCQAATAGG